MANGFVSRPFGHALADLGERYDNLIVVDADLQRGTETDLFMSRFPTRYLNAGVAEANMVGISTGLALSGKTVFCGTFACFTSQRACDQAVVAAYCEADVKLFGIEAGLYSGGNGATHQGMLDLAVMRAMPNMTVYVPCDATETRAIMEYLMEHPGPAYMRAPRKKAPLILDPADYRFRAGRAVRLCEGSDVTLIACGIMVPRALQAAYDLTDEGISCRVVNMSSIKPLDEKEILRAASETGCIVTAENHNILGGLGSAVAEVVTSRCPVPVLRVGIRDAFGEVGTLDWLADRFCIGPAHIVQAAREALDLKEMRPSIVSSTRQSPELTSSGSEPE